MYHLNSIHTWGNAIHTKGTHFNWIYHDLLSNLKTPHSMEMCLILLHSQFSITGSKVTPHPQKQSRINAFCPIHWKNWCLFFFWHSFWKILNLLFFLYGELWEWKKGGIFGSFCWEIQRLAQCTWMFWVSVGWFRNPVNSPVDMVVCPIIYSWCRISEPSTVCFDKKSF